MVTAGAGAGEDAAKVQAEAGGRLAAFGRLAVPDIGDACGRSTDHAARHRPDAVLPTIAAPLP